jgi:hypothetical protein
MSKTILVLALICALGFIPSEPKEIKLDTNSTEAIQKILVHSINVLDNGTFRNNYDSVKLAIQELSSVYSYLENLKKQASDTATKKK